MASGLALNSYAVPQGNHTFTAQLVSDSNYANFQWPNVSGWYTTRAVTASVTTPTPPETGTQIGIFAIGP